MFPCVRINDDDDDDADNAGDSDIWHFSHTQSRRSQCISLSPGDCFTVDKAFTHAPFNLTTDVHAFDTDTNTHTLNIHTVNVSKY